MTSGVCVEGNRLTLLATRLAANATVNRYRSLHALRTCRPGGRAAATRMTSARKLRARMGTPARYATTASGELCDSSGKVARTLLGPVCCDVVRQVSQGAEDLLVLFAVGAELNAILLGDDQRDLENVYGIQAKTLSIQRRLRIDVGRGHIDVQGGDNQLGNLALHSCVVIRRRRLSKRRRFVGHIP